MNLPFTAVRTNGNWEVITPFRRIYCFNLEEVCEFITTKK